VEIDLGFGVATTLAFHKDSARAVIAAAFQQQHSPIQDGINY